MFLKKEQHRRYVQHWRQGDRCWCGVEPGTGKASWRGRQPVLGRKFLSHVVDAHTEIQDLWYRFDAVSQLGNAQVLSAIGKNKSDGQIDQMLNRRILKSRYTLVGFDWNDASSKKGSILFHTGCKRSGR